MSAITYADSGVDRDLADRFVDQITSMVKSTHSKRVKSAIGGYASLFELDSKRLIAASTDGVGTKLKLAFESGKHDTVGIDLVAMSVNDLLCVGAEPLFFLDYIATGKLRPAALVDVMKGITDGCKQSRCALVGGETAEMPGFYSPGEYDLAGFAVGTVEKKKMLPRRKLKPGDTLIGLASSGVHSNGFSLVRKLLERESTEELIRTCLEPTRIYVKSVAPLLSAGKILAAAHITGSGFLNIPRMGHHVSYDLVLPPRAERARIFDWIRQASGLPTDELYQTFNMGIGMVLAVESKNAKTVLASLKRSGEKAWILGQTTKNKPCKIQIREEDPGKVSECELSY